VLIAGIIVLLVALSDFVIAGVVARKHARSTGGLGGGEPPPLTLILRRSGAATALVGAVLVIVGLAS